MEDQEDQEDQNQFRPQYLATRYSHPLDQTIRYMEDSSWYIRWYIKCTSSVRGVRSVTQIAHECLLAASCTDHSCEREKNTCQGEVCQGRTIHKSIECYLNRVPSPTPVPVVFQQWWSTLLHEHIWQPLRTEMVIRSDAQTRLVGVVDCILFRVSNGGSTLELKLLDWKVSTPSSWSKSAGTYQLNLYRHLLETYYHTFQIDGYTYTDVRVVEMSLVYIHPNLTSIQACPVDIIEVQPIIRNLHKKQVEVSCPTTDN